jgi:hypothetical protein
MKKKRLVNKMKQNTGKDNDRNQSNKGGNFGKR